MYKYFSRGELPINGERYITVHGDIMIRHEDSNGVWISCVGYDKSKRQYGWSSSNDTIWKYENEFCDESIMNR